MQVGIFAKTFAGAAPGPVLDAVRRAGFRAAQFNLACAGLDAMPLEVPEEAFQAIEAARDASGVALVALSGTYNMAHPDPTVRADGLTRLAVVLDAARRLAIPLVTLCTGTRDPNDQWAHHPDNADPAAWADMAREMERALQLADRAGIDLGIEPEQANVVTSAGEAVRLIGDMGSPRLRIVLDPANLFERADAAEARRIVAAAVDIAAGRIAMAHAKDRRVDGAFTAAGTGVVDFPDFVARLRAAGFDGPMVTHGLSAEEAPGVGAFLRGLAP